MSSKAISDYEAEMHVPDEPDEMEEDPLALEDEDRSDGEDGLRESGGEDEAAPQGPEMLDEAVEQLTTPAEAATICATRPLKRRTAAHALVGPTCIRPTQ